MMTLQRRSPKSSWRPQPYVSEPVQNRIDYERDRKKDSQSYLRLKRRKGSLTSARPFRPNDEVDLDTRMSSRMDLQLFPLIARGRQVTVET